MVTDDRVDSCESTSVLEVMLPEGGGERHSLHRRETTIGRDAANHIRIEDPFVSGFHAKIVRSGETFSIVDLGSANQTRVNGRPIVQKALKHGDEIHFAGVSCRLIAAGEDIDTSRPGTDASEEGGADPTPALPAPWRPPVSKLYLSAGVVVLFALVAALVSRACS